MKWNRMEIKNENCNSFHFEYDYCLCDRAVRKKFNGAGKKFKAFFNAYNSNTHILMEKKKNCQRHLYVIRATSRQVY